MNTSIIRRSEAAIPIALLIALLLAGCSTFRGGESMTMYDEAPAGAARAATSDMAAPEPEPAPEEAIVSTQSADEAQKESTDTVERRRLRVYSGHLSLIVDEVEAAKQRIIAEVETNGGYVESTSAEYIVVRVPAAQFFDAYEFFGTLGEVSDRSVTTDDVTEQFSDLEQRIALATATRSRLYELLGETEDVEERVLILREIRRLTEEIDRLTSARDTLAGRIAMSRISVRLSPRVGEAASLRSGIPFYWIARLDPLRVTTGKSEKDLDLILPDDFAILDSGKTIRAETAEGTRFRLGMVENDPVGDTAFWHRAVSFHLRELYRSADEIEAGEYRGVLFTSKDIVPFHFLIAVRVVDDGVEVAEAFFPDDAARERRIDSILDVLGGEK